MRRFEEQYRLNEGDDVLNRENAIHQDVDLRLDAVEQDAEAFRAGNRADIEAILKSLEETFGDLAAEMRGLLDQAQGGLSADIIVESAARYFLTDARRAAILAEAASAIRDGVDGSADTLAKLLVKISEASSAASAAASAAAGRVSKTGDTMSGGLTVPSIALGNAGDLKIYVDKGVRTDVVAPFTASQRKVGRSNLGMACGTGYLANAVTLAPGHIGFDFLVSSSAVVTLQDIANFADGDGMGFVGWDGSSAATIQVPAGSNTKIDLNGVQVSSFTLRPGQTARLSVWQGAWLVSAYAAPFGTTLSAREAQAFTDTQKQQLLANADIAIPHGQCRLNYVSATQIRLDQCNGSKLFINGNYRPIPASGVSLSNAGLSANTRYCVYAYWSAGSLAMLAVAAGTSGNAEPVISPAYGNKIAGNGDNNFALVGMVYTNANGQFQDDASWRGVSSTFNSRIVDFGGVVAEGVNVATASFTNLGTQFLVLTQGDDAIDFSVIADAGNTAAGGACSVICNLAGVNLGRDGSGQSASAGAQVNLSPRVAVRRPAGAYLASAYGKVSSNSGIFYVSLFGTLRA